MDDASRLAAIASIVDKPVVHSAPAIILCVVDHRPVYHGLSFGIEDCAAATANILLAITELGYASVWLDGVLRVERRAQRVAAPLDIPADREVRIVLPLGRPADTGAQPAKKPFTERAAFNHWPGP